jgi:hypothetical protein
VALYDVFPERRQSGAGHAIMERNRMTKGQLIVLGTLLTGAIQSTPVRADDPPTIAVMLKDHRFSPSEIHVPAGKAVILHITNEDDTADEFDSVALQVEKVIPAGHYATVRLRPLAQGQYPFMGEFHAATAKGVVISDDASAPPR